MEEGEEAELILSFAAEELLDMARVEETGRQMKPTEFIREGQAIQVRSSRSGEPPELSAK